MNTQARINQCLRLTSDGYRKDKNSIRLNTHNTKTHELAKCALAYDLIKEGREVYTEVVFKNNKRADILVPELFMVYEVLESETEEECLSKTIFYPKELDIKMITTEEILNGIHF